MQVEQQSLTSTALRNTVGGAVPPFRSVSASRAPNTEHTGGGVGGCGGERGGPGGRGGDGGAGEGATASTYISQIELPHGVPRSVASKRTNLAETDGMFVLN